MDFRVGGRFRYCIRSDDREVWAHGVYREIKAPERLVFTFRWEGKESDPETLIDITLEARGAQTLMTFRQGPFTSADTRDGHTQGWQEVLDSFAAWLKQPAPL